MTRDPAQAFADLVPAADPQAARRTATALLHRWAEPHRRYHTTTHLVATLRAVDLLLAGTGPGVAPAVADRGSIELAVWYHDAVYLGRPGADEEASAQLAEQELGALGEPAARVTEVARLVRLTAAHAPGDHDVPGQVLVDADLAILAAGPADYAAYAAAVRAEYAHVPDAAFAAGRAQVLRRLVSGPLYATARGRALWDGAARANVTAELARLTPARSG